MTLRRVLAVLALAACAVAWPRLRPPEPALPGEAVPARGVTVGAPVDPTPGVLVPPPEAAGDSQGRQRPGPALPMTGQSRIVRRKRPRPPSPSSPDTRSRGTAPPARSAPAAAPARPPAPKPAATKRAKRKKQAPKRPKRKRKRRDPAQTEFFGG